MLTVFKQFISYIKYLFLCIGYNVKSSIANRKSFLIQTISMFINNFIFILFWLILFKNKGGSINGIEFNDIMYLWSIPTMAYGIAYFCFGGTDTLCKDIVDGNLDIYLTKPKHSLISQLTSRSILSAMGDFLSGLVCGLYAVNCNPIKLIEMLLISIIAAGIYVGVINSLKLLAFYFGDITTVVNRYTNSLFITLTIYPEQMFPKFVKVLMYTAIPAMYVAHIPIKLVKHFDIGWFLILVVAFIFFTWLLFFMYERGLKRYSSGNGTTRR